MMLDKMLVSMERILMVRLGFVVILDRLLIILGGLLLIGCRIFATTDPMLVSFGEGFE